MDIDIVGASQYDAPPRLIENEPSHHRRSRELEQSYSFRDVAAVQAFLHANPELVELLCEAYGHLEKHFGPDPQVALAVISDPEGKGADQLFAYIVTSLEVEEAVARLDGFDMEWFLDQLGRAGGRLNFSLEFV